MARASAIRVLPVAGLVLLGLVLRAAASQQSLFGDELFTYAIVTEPGLGGVFDGIERTENTPPLFYVLSWLSAKVGDPTTWLRAPSVIAGAATVPLVYLLAFRAGGRAAGIGAAAAFAIAPFAVFYGSEARAYALVALLASLSTLLMVLALKRDRRWWVAFVLVTAAAVYTQYVAILPLAAQAGWALWRHRLRWREIVLANAAAALAFVPWLPQLGNNVDVLRLIRSFFPFDAESVARETLRPLIGHPGTALDVVPGTVGLVLLAAAVLVAGVGSARIARSRRRPPADTSTGPGEVWLLAMLALAAPVGLFAYSALETPIYIGRNLFVSAPFAIALAAVLVARLPTPLAAAAAALAIGGISIGAVRSFEADQRRPDMRGAVELIAASGEPGDPVVELPIFPQATELRRDLATHLPAEHPLDLRLRTSPAWSQAGRLYVVVPDTPPAIAAIDAAAERYGARLRAEQVLRGLVPLSVRIYATGASAARRGPARAAPARDTAG